MIDKPFVVYKNNKTLAIPLNDSICATNAKIMLIAHHIPTDGLLENLFTTLEIDKIQDFNFDTSLGVYISMTYNNRYRFFLLVLV